MILWLVIATVLTLGGAATLSATVIKQKVSGVVTCPEGMDVAGVFVVSGTIGSDFAPWEPKPGHPNIASFTYKVPTPQVWGWSANVGCGKVSGDEDKWQTDNEGPTIHGTTMALNCRDLPPPPYPTKVKGRCTLG